MSVETPRADGAYTGYAAPGERPPFGPYAGAGGAVQRRDGRRRGWAPSAAAATCPSGSRCATSCSTGVATHKLSRLISKDRITAFARAPFTEFQEPGGPAEVEERARGDGWRRTIGELLVCPYCLGMWISGGFNLGLVVAPRGTRFAASVLTGLTISDFLQIAYKAAEDRGLGGS